MDIKRDRSGASRLRKDAPDKCSAARHLTAALIRTAAFAAAAAACGTFLFGLATVPDNDMFPQIRAGDLALFYRPGKPLGQDAVIYEREGRLAAGRIAASEGDTVEVSGSGELMVNGIQQPALKRLGIYSETKINGGAEEYPVTLGEDQYFILGDDRESARDSRSCGIIDRDEIKGVIFVLLRRQAV